MSIRPHPLSKLKLPFFVEKMNRPFYEKRCSRMIFEKYLHITIAKYACWRVPANITLVTQIERLSILRSALLLVTLFTCVGIAFVIVILLGLSMIYSKHLISSMMLWRLPTRRPPLFLDVYAEFDSSTFIFVLRDGVLLRSLLIIATTIQLLYCLHLRGYFRY